MDKRNRPNYILSAFQMVLGVKNLPAKAGVARDAGSVPALGRSPREGNVNLFQYSSLENSMGRRAWWGTVHGVAKSRTQLIDQAHILCTKTHFKYKDLESLKMNV